MVRASSSASVSAAKWLVGVMVSVVFAFAFATAVTEYYERAVADRAEDIIGNAMPSVQTLSAARGDLRVLESDLERFVHAPTASRSEQRDDISSIRQNFQESLATYVSLPFFPSERELYTHVEEDLGNLDRSIEAVLAAPDDQTLAHLHHQIDLIDAALQRVVSFDAAQGERLGLRIQGVHGRAAVLAAFLDSASFLLALIASVLALRQLRRAARAREAERATRDLRERELAEKNEALGQFAGRIAHDVLSPLGTVQLSCDFLRQTTALEPPAQRAVDRAESSVQRVKTLVDGLLTFSRAGGHPEPDVSTEVAPALADMLGELGAQANKHQIALTVSPIPTGAVACSVGVLTSIISNLVRNAIKYMNDSDDRRIMLRVKRVGARWRFEVQDTGPGIPAEDRQRIFEPYIQLAKGSAGIGLGLATVDRLVRAHGGSVGVASAPERGALVWFELPAWQAVTAATPISAHVASAQRHAT
jgi:signal transduction histidine kinase